MITDNQNDKQDSKASEGSNRITRVYNTKTWFERRTEQKMYYYYYYYYYYYHHYHHHHPVASVSKKNKRLTSCSPPHFHAQHYFSPNNKVHLSYVIIIFLIETLKFYIQWVAEHSVVLKCSGCETDRWLSSSAAVQNEWSGKSVLHLSLRGAYRKELNFYILSRLQWYL